MLESGDGCGGDIVGQDGKSAQPDRGVQDVGFFRRAGSEERREQVPSRLGVGIFDITQHVRPRLPETQVECRLVGILRLRETPTETALVVEEVAC